MQNNKRSGVIWRLMSRLNRRVARNYQLGIRPGRLVLLLTTVGRKTGLPRVTPLQYEEINGVYYLGSARGAQADWFRNVQANTDVTIQIKNNCFEGTAEAVTDPGRIADFFELRLQRHPRMIGWLMRLEGLPANHSRQDLERFAASKTLVIVRPRIS